MSTLKSNQTQISSTKLIFVYKNNFIT